MKLLNFWQRMHFRYIREFFWPLLEKEMPTQADNKELDVAVSNENLDTALELTRKMLEGEEERRKGIESKAALFLSTISIATTLVIASSNLIKGDLQNVNATKVSVVISFILSLYMIRTVWFSVKALERGNYSILGFKDINYKGDSTDYKKHLIMLILDKMKTNSLTINKKVDNLAMAQAYYKRGIVTISIYAFVILLFCFIKA